MLSERCGVTIFPSSATSFLSGRLGMGRMRKPIAVMSMAPLDELHRDAAQGTEVAVQGVALVGEHDASERAGEDEVTGFERRAHLPQFVREPGDAQGRMAENACGEPRLLDLGIAVHDSAHPAQVRFHRADRAPADDEIGRAQRLNSSHVAISYAVFCLKKKNRLTSSLLMVKPRHVQPYLQVVSTSACVKLETISFCFSLGMPMPLSATVNRSVTRLLDEKSFLTLRQMLPSLVNLTELD